MNADRLFRFPPPCDLTQVVTSQICRNVNSAATSGRHTERLNARRRSCGTWRILTPVAGRGSRRAALLPEHVLPPVAPVRPVVGGGRRLLPEVVVFHQLTLQWRNKKARVEIDRHVSTLCGSPSCADFDQVSSDLPQINLTLMLAWRPWASFLTDKQAATHTRGNTICFRIFFHLCTVKATSPRS